MAEAAVPSDDVPEVEPRTDPGDPTDEGQPPAAAHDDADVQPPSSPPEAAVDSPEDEEAMQPRMPPFVIECPNCHSSFPWVAELEGFVPSESTATHKCEECDGMGVVSTGSFVTAKATIPCTVCNGDGYIANEGVALPTVTPQGDPPWQGATWNAALGTWT